MELTNYYLLLTVLSTTVLSSSNSVFSSSSFLSNGFTISKRKDCRYEAVFGPKNAS